MNQDTNNTNFVQQDEISLLELFMALWRQKILIVVIALVAGLVTGIISVFVITPVYHAKLNIVINMPETYQTKYGEYTLPISSNEQYINLITSNDILANTILDMGYNPSELSIESLRERISILKKDNTNTVQNSFDIKVASDNPEDARKLAEVLYNNYIEFIDLMVAEGATRYFIDYYNIQLQSLQVDLDSSQELLAKNQELLNHISMTINQREAMDELLSSDNTTNFVVMGDIINPNYTELELDIIEIKQNINTIENTMNQYSIYLEELAAKISDIEGYYGTGDFSRINDKIISITRTNIYLPSEPVAPSSKTSPSNSKNVIIGTLLGGMIAVLIALVREFWFNKE